MAQEFLLLVRATPRTVRIWSVSGLPKSYDPRTFQKAGQTPRITISSDLTAETPSLVVPLEDRVVSTGETVALQCKATGNPTPRITWLKGGRPLSLTERHHFTPGNQLLIVQNVVVEDAGQYTCEISNTLGTERAHSQLSVVPAPGCRRDGGTVGVFTIAVVCSIVLTSLVWVCIIYQTRKKSEEYSVTNTGQPLLARRQGASGLCTAAACWLVTAVTSWGHASACTGSLTIPVCSLTLSRTQTPNGCAFYTQVESEAELGPPHHLSALLGWLPLGEACVWA